MELTPRVLPKKNFKILGLVLVIFVITYALLTFRFVSSTYKLALAGKTNLEQSFVLIQDQRFDEAKIKIKAAEKNFRAARSSIRSAYLWRPIPWVGTQVKAVNNVMSAGVRLTLALEDSLDLAEDLLSEYLSRKDLSFDQLTTQEKGDILAKIAKSEGKLIKIKKNIDETIELLSEIPEKGVYKPIAKALEPIKENIPNLKIVAESVIPLTTVIPQLAGHPEPATYLFLLQNNDELRPTGGFIGTYGILKVNNGEITQFNTDNTYNLDDPASKYLNVPPPQPLMKYLLAEKWLFRDSNWSPDFPTTAKQAEWFYHQEGGVEQQFQGVIAITPVFVSEILKVIGNQQVDGILFTPENLSDRLEERVGRQYYSLGIPESERKGIVGKLGLKIREEIFKLPIKQWGDIIAATIKALDQKHFLIYSKAPKVQQLVEVKNWAGKVKPVESDYLLVIDTNLASLKTDQVIDRDINYRLRPEGDELIAKVLINYHNRGVFTWKTTRLRTYTRVYVPKGSQLISSSGLMDNDRTTRPGQVETGEEFGKTFFAGFISIEPQQSGTLSFEYRLPKALTDKIKKKGYLLLVQKQPGTIGHIFNGNIQFRSKIKQWNPKTFNTRLENANTVIFNTNLETDREFDVQF